jgi:hypothetical protein
VEVFKRFDYAFIALQHYGSAKIQSDYAPYWPIMSCQYEWNIPAFIILFVSANPYSIYRVAKKLWKR